MNRLRRLIKHRKTLSEKLKGDMSHMSQDEVCRINYRKNDKSRQRFHYQDHDKEEEKLVIISS